MAEIPLGGFDMPKGTPGRVSCSIKTCPEPAHGAGYCKAHYQRWRRTGDPLQLGSPRRTRTPQDLFWSHVNKHGPIPEYAPDLGECWIWEGADIRGYGCFRFEGKTYLAHRLAYEWTLEPIAAGLELDHPCRVTLCLRPSHLDPVTPRTNNLRGFSTAARHARQTHCIYGHEFTSENTHLWIYKGRTHRVCLACRKRRNAERYR